MWLVNMNCLGVLGKKLAGVKCGKMVGGYPWVGGGWVGLCEMDLEK